MLARSPLRLLADWGLVALLFSACALLVLRLDEVSLRSLSGGARVVDGDTLVLDGTRIRLAGIDAFEREQSCRRDGSDYACGDIARRRLAELASGGRVACAGRTVDRYGRLVATCTADGIDLNAAMVESGWAVAWGGYEREERAARTGRAGAWAGEFVLPADWRAGRGGAYEPRGDWLRRLVDLIVQMLTGRGDASE